MPSSEEDLEISRAWIKSASENPGFDTPLRTRMIEGTELANRLVDAQTPWKIGGFEKTL